MKEVNIKGKVFTEEEICNYGKKSIAKTRKILMIIGISLIGFCILFICTQSISSASADLEIVEVLASGVVGYGVPGAILLIISFFKGKKDPYTEGVKYLNRHFPYPVGFDGNIIELLQGDKTIEISAKPVTKLIISSGERNFQVVQNNTYSRIFTEKDVLEYEIKVDNEVVITSKTKNKKGVGKALVGGALFGGAGMIAGAVAGNGKSQTSQSQKEIHHYIFVLRVNDILKSSFVMELPSLQTAEEVAATLEIICRFENKIEENDRLELNSNKHDSQLDKFEEIKKYKELLDIGIITQEEFENKKKNLLG